MSNKLFWTFCCLLLIVATNSCKSKKVVSTKPVETKLPQQGPTPTEVVLNTVDANTNNFSFYQSRAKVNYKDDKQKVELDVNLIMEKDQYIWMSVTAVLGIEVARIMITQDSVKILDRLHRKYIAADFDYIQRMSNVPLKLNNLQNLIVGNTVFNNSVQKSVVDTILGALSVSTLINTQKQTTFYNTNYKVNRTLIAEQNQSRQLNITYPTYATFDQNVYPSALNINIRAEKNIECTFELSNFVFTKKRETQFTVPSGYEVVKP
jgi:outer membrane biogenesis lipoprotein LolB